MGRGGEQGGGGEREDEGGGGGGGVRGFPSPVGDGTGRGAAGGLGWFWWWTCWCVVDRVIPSASSSSCSPRPRLDAGVRSPRDGRGPRIGGWARGGARCAARRCAFRGPVGFSRSYRPNNSSPLPFSAPTNHKPTTRLFFHSGCVLLPRSQWM
jgi:hypothetical protein